MAVLFANFAQTTLASGIAASGAATSLSLTDASEMPNPGAGDYFYLILQNELKQREIVKVTARAGNTLTVVRGQEGTTIRAWDTNDLAWTTLTKQGIADIKAEITTAIAAAKEEAINEGALDGYPIGAFIPWGKDGALPENLLELDGSAVSRGGGVSGAAYTALYAVYGTYYGVGDGVTTFTLPDLRARTLRGVDGGTGRDTGAAARTLAGVTVNDKAGSTQDDDVGPHSHNINGGWAHALDSGQFNYICTSGANGQPTTANNTGTETRMKNMSVRWCTKWK